MVLPALPSTAPLHNIPFPSLPLSSKGDTFPLPSLPLPSKGDSVRSLPFVPTQSKGVPITTPSSPKGDNPDNLQRSTQPNKPIIRLVAVLTPVQLRNRTAFDQTPVPSGPQQTIFRGSD